MPISVRLRFEVFKRDQFACRYCGQSSPSVVLEIDHIVPLCEGGTDDPLNLTTSCWSCNRGKAGIPLQAQITGEDPHDKAVALLEQERQIREHDAVLASSRQRRENEAWELMRYWKNDDDLETCNRREFSSLLNILAWLPKEQIRDFMDCAISAGVVRDLRYVFGCVRNLREQRAERSIRIAIDEVLDAEKSSR